MQSSEEKKEEAPVLSSSCQFPGGGRYFGAVRGDEPVCRRKSPPGLLEFSLSGCSPRSKSLCTVLPGPHAERGRPFDISLCSRNFSSMKKEALGELWRRRRPLWPGALDVGAPLRRAASS